MKNKLFKTLTIFGLSFIAWNCSNDPASPSGATSELPAIQQKQMLEVDQQSWLLNTGSQVFLIVPNGTGTYTVTDAFSNPVGTFNTATKSISDAAGNTTVVSVDLSSLPIVNPDKTITYPDGSKTTLTGEPISSGVTVNSSSALEQLFCLQSGYSGCELQLRQNIDPSCLFLFAEDSTTCR